MKLKKTWLWTIVVSFLICFIIRTYWTVGENLFKLFFTSLTPFLIGAMIAFVVNIVLSVYELIYDKYFQTKVAQKMIRPLSLVLSYLTFILVIITIFSIVIPDLIASLRSLLGSTPSNIQNFLTDLEKNPSTAKVLDSVWKSLGTEEEIVSKITTYAQQILTQVLSSLNTVVSSIGSIASSLINLFVSLIFSIYVLANKEKLARQSSLLIDTYLSRIKDKVYFVLEIINNNFKNFFVGQTIEAVILGSLTALGMLLLQIPYATTIGILVGFTALIPVVGAYIGLVIGVVMISTVSFSKVIIFIIFLVIIQQIEGNLIYPKVVGNSVSLPGMWVLLAITVGGALYGVFGMLVAVPTFATIYQLIRHDVYRRQESKS